MMVKAGPAVDAVIQDISPYLEAGDLLIDGGNSEYHDTERRVAELESKSFGFIGMGVSGGAKGALEGPSMMPGGTKSSYDAIESLVCKMAAQVEDGPCVTYIGPGGSGHFVKTVHNGIEYGIEQILAEAYDLLKRVGGQTGTQMADIFRHWNSTEELASYLVEITEVCLRTKDPSDGSDLVEKIVDQAGQKGTGLWTVVSAPSDGGFCADDLCRLEWPRDELDEASARRGGIHPPRPGCQSLRSRQPRRWQRSAHGCRRPGLHGELRPGNGIAADRLR